MSAVMDRIQRWSRALPRTDSIPVSPAEAWELARLLSVPARTTRQSGSKLYLEQGEVLKSLEDGTLRVMDHPIVVL